MKKIGSIDIKQAPLGMMICNKKDNRYYIANINKKGKKQWQRCVCKHCLSQNGGATNLAPGPEQHSWHHHHAPFYQVFNNYVCVKRDTLGEIRDFFLEMFSSKNYSQNKPPFSYNSNKL